LGRSANDLDPSCLLGFGSVAFANLNDDASAVAKP
jgi:hypothetical protein